MANHCKSKSMSTTVSRAVHKHRLAALIYATVLICLAPAFAATTNISGDINCPNASDPNTAIYFEQFLVGLERPTITPPQATNAVRILARCWEVADGGIAETILDALLPLITFQPRSTIQGLATSPSLTNAWLTQSDDEFLRWRRVTSPSPLPQWQAIAIRNLDAIRFRSEGTESLRQHILRKMRVARPSAVN